jgi:hypothetical protein
MLIPPMAEYEKATRFATAGCGWIAAADLAWPCESSRSKTAASTNLQLRAEELDGATT